MQLPRWVAAAALAASLALGAGCDRVSAPRPAAAGTAQGTAPAATPRYEHALRQLDSAVEAARAEAASYPGSWAVHERLAGLHLERQQLTGQYEEFSAAEAGLQQARRIAGNDAVVCATQARLDFALHRLAQAAAVAERCMQSAASGARSELAGLLAETALYSGRYADARAQMRELLNEVETIPALVRLSRLHAMTGHASEALALLDRAERLYRGESAQLRAWLQLQRAEILMDRGRLEDALAYLLAAERQMSGWWLVDEHIAEVKALLGRHDEARALYRDVMQRTGLPEYMDALALLERKAGNEAEAKALVDRAEALYRERLARWPEAAAGHALDHWLLFRPQDPETLRLASVNAGSRPYGAALIQLAQARLAAGDAAGAARELRAALASEYDSAELRFLAGVVFAALGEAAEAQRQQAIALRMNPRASQMYGG